MKALVIQGYPAFDAPIIAYGLRRLGVRVEVREKEWVEPDTFHQFDLVVIDGSFTRAGIQPDRFREQDLPHIDKFLEAGGTLMLMRERTDLFATDHGKPFLNKIIENDISHRFKNSPFISQIRVDMFLPFLSRAHSFVLQIFFWKLSPLSH